LHVFGLATMTTGVVVVKTVSVCVAVGAAVTVMVLGTVSCSVSIWVMVTVTPGADSVICGPAMLWVAVDVTVRIVGVTRQLHALEICEGAKLRSVAGRTSRFWKSVCAGAVTVAVWVANASGCCSVTVVVTVIVSMVSTSVVTVSAAAVTVMVTTSPVTVAVYSLSVVVFWFGRYNKTDLCLLDGLVST
jgi:hypothetical protein